MIKILSNQLSRKINNFAKQFGLTGVQVQIIDYLNHLPKINLFIKKTLNERLIFAVRRLPAFCKKWKKTN